MADDIKISIGANTDNFQTAIEKSFKTLVDFGNKNKDLATVTDASYRQLAKIAASTSGSVQSAFNEMQIKSDASMEAMKISLSKASAAFNTSFNRIVESANTSSNDVERAFRKLNELNLVLDASSLKSEFQTLGVQSAASIEAAKAKIVNAFEEIKLTGTKYPQDIVRAHEAMTTELARLDGLLVTGTQKSANERAAAELKMLEEAIGLNQKFNAEKIQAQIKMYDEAVAIDQKLAYEKRQAQIKMHEEAVLMDQKRTYQMQQEAKKRAEIERALYAAQGLTGEGSAAGIIGQGQAGKDFANRLKTQMEEAAVATQLMVTEMASYASQAMQGELAAAKLVGQLQAGAGFAAQLKAQMEGTAQASASTAKHLKEVEAANAYAMRNQGASSDRFQGSFDTLGLKSSMNIEAEKARVIAAFNQIKNSGVASANEIKQAHAAMKKKLDEIDGVAPASAKHTNSINLLSLASVAAIAKVQILYSLINQTMSLIGSLPKTAVDAIETFQSSMVKNAAIITSMQGGVKNIGLAYKENRQYAEAVQNTLVKMDAQTIASYSQLQLMNDAFVQQGVFIDINNKKQLDGYRNVANALATISAGMSNPDMQFSQEIRGLMNGEDKPTNMMFRTLKAVDPLLKEHLADWKRIASETGNAGYVLEKLAPLLQGFAAASGDIDSLWATVKSTMTTIRDEVLRGGLSQGFHEIVMAMKEVSKYAEENKEKIQAFLRDGFGWAKVAAEYMYNLGKYALYLAEPAMWLAISAGIIRVATSMATLTTEITLATAGLNVLVAGLIASAVYTGKNYFKKEELDQRLANIRPMAVDTSGGQLAAGIKRERIDRINSSDLEKILKANPIATDEQIARWIKAGAISKSNANGGGLGSLGLSINQNAIKAIEADIAAANAPKIPKPPKGGDSEKAEKATKELSELQDKFSKALENTAKQLRDSDPTLSEYDKKMGSVTDTVLSLSKEFPDHIDKWNMFGQAMIDNVSLADSMKLSASELKQEIKELEGSLKGTTGFGGFAQGLNMDFGLKPEPKMKFGFGEQPSFASNYSLTGPSETSVFGFGNELKATGDKNDELLKLERDFQRDMFNVKADSAQSAIALAKSAAGDNKALLITTMVAEKALAIARIMMNTEIAASAAIAAAAMIPGAGVAIGAAQAAAIRAMSYVSIGMVMASGAIEGMQIAGKRELGGPVSANSTYLVGEKGPELFTPGANGVITPNNRLGGGSNVTINQIFNAPGADASTLAQMKVLAHQAKEAAKAEILNSMNRGGDFALASGRVR